jgi:hypothetical protein
MPGKDRGVPCAEFDATVEKCDILMRQINAQQAKIAALREMKNVFKSECNAAKREIERLKQVEDQHHLLVRIYNDLENYMKGQPLIGDSVLKSPQTRHADLAVGVLRRGGINYFHREPIFFSPRFFSKNVLSNSGVGSSLPVDKEVESDKFISFKHRFIFFAVPKVASQSVILLLKTACQEVGFLHSKEPLSKLLENAPEISEFFKFAVVRHPFARLVSCYIDKILNINFKKKKMLNAAGLRYIPTSFANFVDAVSLPSSSDRDADQHWASQTGILSTRDGALLVDAVVHLEHLEAELAIIFKYLGLKPPVFNKVKNTRKQHIEMSGFDAERFDDAYFWTKSIEDKLLVRYANDYKNFGYLSLATATLSVVICTHNRREDLGTCIQLLAQQIFEIDATRIEVLVVDNNSSDGTEIFIDDLIKEYDWLTLAREDKLGLSHARNCGAKLARGDYLCYLDDDSRPCVDYLKNVFRVIDEHTPDILGGPVFPFYTSPKPFWFQDALEIRQHANVSGFSDCPISGGNFIIRAELLKQLGMFSPDYGMVGAKLRLGEERELLERYRRQTHKGEQRVYYSLECLIYHHVPAWKMTLRYFVHRAFASGEMKATLADGINTNKQGTEQYEGGKQMFVNFLQSIMCGSRGICLPIRFLHRLALICGMFARRLEILLLKAK